MIGFWSQLRDKLLPKSIVTRMSLILFIGIIVAQILSTIVWTRQFEQSERKRLEEVSEHIGARIGQTLQFFSRLPREYRHVVLDQLRDMGGTRFFVSVNKQRIILETIPDSELQRLIATKLNSQIVNQLERYSGNIVTEFVEFSNLRVLSRENQMVELPKRWQRFALLDPGDNSPAIVVQIQLHDDEWMYLATVFPEGDALNTTLLSSERVVSLIFVTATVLLLITLMVLGIVRPLRRLARHADALGRGQSPGIIPVEGTSEMQTTIRAFNDMSQRLEKFISDRERLFASISHDFKTPLTRARLRAELITDDPLRAKLIGDLENLDMLVKASLQIIKDGAIHENSTQINFNQLINRCLDSARIEGLPCSAQVSKDLEFEGRPMALERLFTNLIDNALHYGRGVEIFGFREIDSGNIILQVCDRGPGLTDEQKSQVFEPFYRVQRAPSTVHVGLGMGIVKTIAQLHGASVELQDRSGGGLIVELRFPFTPTGEDEQH